MSSQTALLDMSLSDLELLVADHGAPRFRAKQIADWVFSKRVVDVEEMANLPKNLRAALASEYSLGRADPESVTTSSDGTKKYLFPAGRARSMTRFVEAAYIPEENRATLCLSTQIGCSMGCLFCMTARQGLQGNLTAGEIVNQYLSLPERDSVTNIVYMGMGEPLDNVEPVLKSLEMFTQPWGLGLSHKRITVSTIGVVPGLRRFLEESSCHLAVSLHSPFDDERRSLMPIQHVYPLSEVLEVIRSADVGRQRRVSFEYIVFKGLNHSARHVKELTRLLYGIRCRVNLIRFHEIPGAPLHTAGHDEMVEFQNALKAKGIPTTIRASRGQDVEAACGMLSTKRHGVPVQEDY